MVAAAGGLVSPVIHPVIHPVIQQHVCPLVSQCAGLNLGSADHQQRVVDVFFDLAAAYDVSHGQGYVLRALLDGDAWAARELCMGFDAYNAGLALIHAVLQSQDATLQTIM